MQKPTMVDGIRFTMKHKGHDFEFELLVGKDAVWEDRIAELWFSIDQHSLKMYCIGIPLEDADGMIFMDYIESYLDNLYEDYMRAIEVLEEV